MINPASIAVLVVDDEYHSSFAFSNYLRSHGFHNIAEFSNYEDTLELTGDMNFDVAVIDIKLPRNKPQTVLSSDEAQLLLGLDLARDLRRRWPHIGLVLISADNQLLKPVRELMKQLGNLGIAYVVKAATRPRDLITAIERVIDQESFIDDSACEPKFSSTAERYLRVLPDHERFWVERGCQNLILLTQPQIDLARLIADGRPFPEIAQIVGLTARAIEGRWETIRNKMFGENSKIPLRHQVLLVKVFILHDLNQ
ncbi:hypothetical protein ANRL4_03726 [Anaerolineae bacterium]|nr:hypothetical protein ANRL4_03726 [Anaerolineae bacterium]